MKVMVYSTLSGASAGVTDCGQNLIELSAQTFCANVMGVSFGSGKIVGGSDGVSPFKHQMKTKIKAIVYSKPRAIERTVSRHCKTQRTRSSALFIIEGTDLIPEWKKDEIELMFMQERIYINDGEVVSRGGSVIKSLGDACEGLYSIAATVEMCEDENIFGCISPNQCLRKGGVIVVPPDADNDTSVFTDNGFYAGKVSDLTSWLTVQPGVVDVEVIADTSTMLCEPFMAVKFSYDNTNGLPVTALYVSQYRQQNRVGVFITDYDNPDLQAACNGVDYSDCTTVTIGAITFTNETCGVLTIGTVTFVDTNNCNSDINSVLFNMSGSITLVKDPDGLCNLTITGRSDKYILPPAYNQASTARVIVSGEEGGFIAGLNSMIVNSVKLNGVWMDTPDFNYNAGTDTLSKVGGTWAIGDTVEYFYAAGVPEIGHVNKMLVAVLSCSECVGVGSIYVPVGNGVVEIAPNGSVFYTGLLNNANTYPFADIWVNPDLFNFSIDIDYLINN